MFAVTPLGRIVWHNTPSPTTIDAITLTTPRDAQLTTDLEIASQFDSNREKALLAETHARSLADLRAQINAQRDEIERLRSSLLRKSRAARMEWQALMECLPSLTEKAETVHLPSGWGIISAASRLLDRVDRDGESFLYRVKRSFFQATESHTGAMAPQVTFDWRYRYSPLFIIGPSAIYCPTIGANNQLFPATPHVASGSPFRFCLEDMDIRAAIKAAKFDLAADLLETAATTLDRQGGPYRDITEQMHTMVEASVSITIGDRTWKFLSGATTNVPWHRIVTAATTTSSTERFEEEISPLVANGTIIPDKEIT